MKTAALASLVLAAMAHAAPALEARQDTDGFVLLCTEKRCLGGPPLQQTNEKVTFGICFDIVKDLKNADPVRFNNNVSAISFNSNVQCQLHDSADCKDPTPGAFQKGRIDDLATLNFDNKLSSLFCKLNPTN